VLTLLNFQTRVFRAVTVVRINAGTAREPRFGRILFIRSWHGSGTPRPGLDDALSYLREDRIQSKTGLRIGSEKTYREVRRRAVLIKCFPLVSVAFPLNATCKPGPNVSVSANASSLVGIN
jgi:hypothetical protein